MKSFTFLFLCFSLSFANLHAQGVNQALDIFTQTPFFEEFQQLRRQAEDAVRKFKLTESRYSDEEIILIQNTYNSSAKYFNRTLINIKNDLLRKDVRKYLATYPAAYSKQVETDLRNAREYYEATFQKEVSQLTEGEITGSTLLILLPELIQQISTAFALIKQMQDEFKKMNEAYLDQNLVEPYRFRTWEEIM